MKKCISLLLILIFVLSLFVGCSEEKASYTVLMKGDNSPYSYEDKGEIVGLEADIIEAVANIQGFDVKFTNDEGANYTCCSGDFTRNSDDYDYTDAFYQCGIVFITHAKSEITAYEQLINETIGVMENSYGEDFATQIAPQYNMTVKKYTDRNQMYAHTKDSSIAGCFDDQLVVNQCIKNGEKLKTFENSEKTATLSFAVNKGKNSQFIRSFNQGLEKIMKNGKYDQIISKY